MFKKYSLSLAILLAALPALPRDKKPLGEILNKQGLARVQSYCVDTSNLSDPDRYIVNGFLKTESKPKHLLTKLPWKMIADCRNGDAESAVTLEFVALREARVAMGGSTPSPAGNPGQPPVGAVDPRDPEARVKVVLRVADSLSQKLLYRAQAVPLSNTSRDSPMMADPIVPSERRDAVYRAFWDLIEDLQSMRGEHTKN